jgi:hypothetical protein
MSYLSQFDVIAAKTDRLLTVAHHNALAIRKGGATMEYALAYQSRQGRRINAAQSSMLAAIKY